jgi:hypothetical protein
VEDFGILGICLVFGIWSFAARIRPPVSFGCMFAALFIREISEIRGPTENHAQKAPQKILKIHTLTLPPSKKTSPQSTKSSE